MSGGNPSGEQYPIRHGPHRAVVTEVGASLRLYDCGDVAACLGFREDEMSTGGRGQILAPWPNRLRGGRYEFDGRTCQLPIDELRLPSALHGLVRWVPWHLDEHLPAAVTLSYVLHPQPGYPFTVRLTTRYALSDAGLNVTTTARNEGRRAAPFGLGFHDYLSAGAGLVDGCRLTVPARTHLRQDAERRIVGSEPLTSSSVAFLADQPGPARKLIGPGPLMDCLTDFVSDSSGVWTATLSRDGLPPVALWAEAAFGWAMVYTGDSLEPPLARTGVAIEPMTCPPDAFLSGDGLIRLEPGGQFRAAWGVIPSEK